ncbi:unnamed protein product [Pleuronectes platessa]|uniref:Uncharacterized protein n=1 Tax=Pleuronectes platessa TaxID=8262 RepID=A0A9N7VCH1_PLEPL|nr:unnamed protein product [Pleuronectes platessa]
MHKGLRWPPIARWVANKGTGGPEGVEVHAGQNLDHRVTTDLLWEGQGQPADHHRSTWSRCFKRISEALKGGGHEERPEGRQTDGEGSDKVADRHLVRPVLIQEVLGDKGGYSDTWGKLRTDGFSHKDKEEGWTVCKSQVNQRWSSLQKDDPPLFAAISSIPKVVPSQCPLA